MRTRGTGYAEMLVVLAAIILATASLSAAAPSAGVFQRAVPATANARPAAPPDGAKPESALTAGREYRLVFPTSSAGTAKTVDSEDEPVRASKFDGFVEQLNKAGAEGYRLTSFVYAHSGLPVGLVRRAAARYEYMWVAFRYEYGWLEARKGSSRSSPPCRRRASASPTTYTSNSIAGWSSKRIRASASRPWVGSARP